MTIRAAAVAGRFYPGNESALRRQVEALLGAAEPIKLPGRLIGLVCPHAGYDFAGGVAGWAYRQLVDRHFDTVIILGLSHHVGIPGAKHAVSPEEAYRTPLGVVPLDTALRRELLGACASLTKDARPHQYEHSLEVQLPFLQCVLDDFSIVPIALSRPTEETCRGLATAVAAAVKKHNALVIASTDLSHFPAYDDAVRSDKAMLAVAEKLDSKALLAADAQWMGKGIAGLECTMCGLWPVTCLTMVAEELGGCTAKTLKYANSGDVPEIGDKSRVVGYGAMAVCQEETGGARSQANGPAADDGFTLTAEEQEQILALARQSLEACVNGKPAPKLDSDNPKFTRKSGAFVTLKKKGALRGCIGHIVAREPLQEVIVQMARAAALEDPRFPPVKPNELQDLDLEVSILSPLRPLKSIEEIVVGRHGLVMTHGFRRGVLLPQVPVEQKWDRDEYLTGICRKTGVPDKSWEKGATLEVFTAQVFGEKEKVRDASSGPAN